MKKKVIALGLLGLVFAMLLSCGSAPARRIAATDLEAAADSNQTEIYIYRTPEKKNFIGYIGVYVDGALKAEIARGGTEKILLPNGIYELSVMYPGAFSRKIKFRANGGRMDFTTYVFYKSKAYRPRANVAVIIQEGGTLSPLAMTAVETLQKIPKQSKVAIVYIDDKGGGIADLFTSDLEIILVREGYIIIDRVQLDKIREEQNFQMSGDVDDATAISIGKFAGADIIITGKIQYADRFTPIGTPHRLRLRALDTQTAQVVGAAVFEWNLLQNAAD